MRDKSDLYYECHITIDPIFGSRRQELEKLVGMFDFKLAKLVMFKGPEKQDWKDSQKDTFFTAHDHYYSRLQQRMVDCIRIIQEAGYVVRRYKIEDTIIDSRTTDILALL